MIALITSTIIPNGTYSLYTPTERLQQTKHTIQRLIEVGFTEIYLFDNSVSSVDADQLTTICKNLNFVQTPQFTFKNKGLNEALLILNNFHRLPSDTAIFKISGRYYPNDLFTKDVFYSQQKDFVGVGYYFDKKIGDFSTKAYFVRNSLILKETLVTAVEDMVSYSKGIHGFRSAIASLMGMFRSRLETPYQISIEQSFARILRQKKITL